MHGMLIEVRRCEITCRQDSSHCDLCAGISKTSCFKQTRDETTIFTQLMNGPLLAFCTHTLPKRGRLAEESPLTTHDSLQSYAHEVGVLLNFLIDVVMEFDLCNYVLKTILFCH